MSWTGDISISKFSENLWTEYTKSGLEERADTLASHNFFLSIKEFSYKTAFVQLISSNITCLYTNHKTLTEIMDNHFNKGAKYKRNSIYDLDRPWTLKKYAQIQVELILYSGRLLNVWLIKSKFKRSSSYNLEYHWSSQKWDQVQI